MFYKSGAYQGGEPAHRPTEHRGASYGTSRARTGSRPVDRRDYETRRPKEREMIFGIRAVIEAIDAGKTLDKILIRRDMSSSIGRELLDKIALLQDNGGAEGLFVQRVPVEKLNKYTDKNHQGVIAFLSPVDFYRVEDLVPSLYEQGKTPLLMVLDGVTDVRNFGAIARTCACAGVDAIVIGSRGSVAINGDAIKTSAGALHSLPVCKVDNLQDCLRFLRESGLNIVAATEHSTTNYTEVNMRLPMAIVMGSEEKGIYEENLKLCTHKVRIPMAGTIESLNVSVAAGVMIYEAVRQRG